MIILDSDHFSILQQPRSPQFSRIVAAMEASPDPDFRATVISVEEQTKGWLAAINRTRVEDQPRFYSRLIALIDFYSRWRIVSFDAPAAELFTGLRKAGTRIGTMDLKIAAIAIANNATLLSANARDFEKVPGLKFESWI